MNYDLIETWLKTTIPGIVVLGAFGSILAVLIIRLAKHLLYPIAKKIFAQSVNGLTKHFVGPAAGRITKFVLKNGPDKLPIFYLLQLMKLLLALFFSSCAFAIFTSALAQATDSLATVAVLTPLILSLISLWYGLKYVVIVALSAHYDMERTIEKAKEEALSQSKKSDD